MRSPLLLLFFAALSLPGCRLAPTSNCCAEGPVAPGDSAVCVDCYGVEDRPWWTPRLQCTSHLADDFVVRKTARRCGQRALKEMRAGTGVDLSRHYEAGFLQAYMEIAEGYPGRTPPVPPAEYWKAYYRTPKGKEAAHDWFEGYTAGADRARAERLREKIEVASSYRYAEMRPLAIVPGPAPPEAMPPLPTDESEGATPVPADDAVPPPLPEPLDSLRDQELKEGDADEPPLTAPQPEPLTGDETEHSRGPSLTVPPATGQVVPRRGAASREPESRMPESSRLFPILPPLQEVRAADVEETPTPSATGRVRRILFGHSEPAPGVELVQPDFEDVGPVKLSLEFDGGSAPRR